MADDWRVSGIATDIFFAPDTFESLDDFSGRAAFYASAEATGAHPCGSADTGRVFQRC